MSLRIMFADDEPDSQHQTALARSEPVLDAQPLRIMLADEFSVSPRAFEPGRRLTMDASALISLMGNGNHEQCANFYGMLDFMRRELDISISITRQTMFELTGLLPEAQQQLQHDIHQVSGSSLTDATRREVGHLIRAAIGNSARNSTRYGFIADRQSRNEEFISRIMVPPQDGLSPIELIGTEIDRKFDSRTSAEIEMAAGYLGKHAGEYRISMHDAATLTPHYFDAGCLRLTFRAAHNLGWFPAEELKKNLNKGRHIALDELRRYLNLEGEHPLLAIAGARKDGETADPHVLLGELTAHGLADAKEVASVGRLWKLTLGDMFHSGLLPKNELLEVAKVMNFPLPDEIVGMGTITPNHVWRRCKEPLAREGFFERHVTVNDAARIATLDADAMPPRFPAMSTFASAHTLADAHRQEFNRRSRDLLPYEKAFSQALINEAMTMEEFLKIGVKSGALYSEGNKYKTHDQRITVYFNRIQPGSSHVLINEKRGFASRLFGEAGKNEMTTLTDPRSGKPRSRFELKDLLREAHASMYETQVQRDRRYHRVFDAMLWPAARKDASHLREMARRVLSGPEGGENGVGDGVRLHQIEMDFATRHFRTLVKQLKRKPHETPYTCLQITRADQWDLGELSILSAIASAPAAWTVVNTDRELMSSLTERAVNRELAHKKPDYRTTVERFAQQLQSQESGSLENISVGQLYEEFARMAREATPEQRAQWSEKYAFFDDVQRRVGTPKENGKRSYAGLAPKPRVTSDQSALQGDETGWEGRVSRRRAITKIKQEKG